MNKGTEMVRLGDWVTVSHYHERPTRDEVTTRGEELDGEDGTIALARRPNADPDKRAMVIGVSSVRSEADVMYNDVTGEFWPRWNDNRRRSFIVVKYKLRGRRYWVDAADLSVLANAGPPGPR